jgi:LmbE family N-acetylglucosaminyl deacetylase
VRVLFISPHTDDVELGAGGTLIKLLEQGNEVFWMVFSTAEDSVPDGMGKDTLKKEFFSVADSVGLPAENLRVFDFKVRYLPQHRQEILEELVKARKDFLPDLVVGPSLNDHHQDHQAVANEMIRAYKNSSSIICYELPWNHVVFNSQLFIKLDRPHIEKKIRLLGHYESQVSMDRPYFSPEFISGWAKMRGVQVNTDYSEAYEVVRWII